MFLFGDVSFFEGKIPKILLRRLRIFFREKRFLQLEKNLLANCSFCRESRNNIYIYSLISIRLITGFTIKTVHLFRYTVFCCFVMFGFYGFSGLICCLNPIDHDPQYRRNDDEQNRGKIFLFEFFVDNQHCRKNRRDDHGAPVNGKCCRIDEI